MSATTPLHPGQRVRVTSLCREPRFHGCEGTVLSVKEILPGAFEVLVDLGLPGRRVFVVMPNLCELEIELCELEIEPASGTQPAPSAEACPGGSTGSEADLVTDIVRDLAAAGYESCVVGQRRAKGSGTTTGYPDLSVRSPHWPVGMAMLLEVKTRTGRLSQEQAQMHARGWSVVVRSVDDALGAAQNGDAWLVIGGRADT